MNSRCFPKFLLVLGFFASCVSDDTIVGRNTGDYLGEDPPGDVAKLFAPSIVSTWMNEDGGPIFTPDGNEIFWRIGGSPFSTFVYMKRENGVWSEPAIAPFAGQYQDAALSMAPDGRRIFFASKRPFDGEEGMAKFHTWSVEKVNGAWQGPVPAGPPIDHPDDYYTRVSVSSDGTIIKQSSAPGGNGGWDLYSCEYDGVDYEEQVNLRGDINTEHNEYAPEISPDGTYIIFQSDNRPDMIGQIDLYVSFKGDDGRWSQGINLGETVNTENVEKWPDITPDGKYLFFTSDRPVEVKYALYSKEKKSLDEIEALYEFYHEPKYEPGWGDVYWIGTDVIEKLKHENLITQ